MSSTATASIPTELNGAPWSQEEKDRLRHDAVNYIIPHYGNNKTLATGAKIYVRGEGCYVWDLDGKKYFDSFATMAGDFPSSFSGMPR